MDGAIVDAYSTGRFLPAALARYGCRCVHVRSGAARRDKYAMEQALRKAGLAAPEGMVTSSLAELVHWALRRGSWPVVVKPVSSAGSDNVLFCHSVPDL